MSDNVNRAGSPGVDSLFVSFFIADMCIVHVWPMRHVVYHDKHTRHGA